MVEEHPFCMEHEWRKQQIEKNCRNIEALRYQSEKMLSELGKSVTPKVLYAALALFVTIFLGMFGFSITSNINALKDIKETGVERKVAIKTLFQQQSQMLVGIEGVKRDVANLSEDLREVKAEVREIKQDRR